MDKLVSKADVCDALGIGMSTLNRILAAGEIPYYKIGGSVRFREADVDAYVRRSLVPAKPTPISAAPRASRSKSRVPAGCGYYPGMKVV